MISAHDMCELGLPANILAACATIEQAARAAILRDSTAWFVEVSEASLGLNAADLTRLMQHLTMHKAYTVERLEQIGPDGIPAGRQSAVVNGRPVVTHTPMYRGAISVRWGNPPRV